MSANELNEGYSRHRGDDSDTINKINDMHISPSMFQPTMVNLSDLRDNTSESDEEKQPKAQMKLHNSSVTIKLQPSYLNNSTKTSTDSLFKSDMHISIYRTNSNSSQEHHRTQSNQDFNFEPKWAQGRTSSMNLSRSSSYNRSIKNGTRSDWRCSDTDNSDAEFFTVSAKNKRVPKELKRSQSYEAKKQNTAYDQLVDRHLESNLKAFQRGDKPWMTKEIMEKIQQRDDLFHAMKELEEDSPTRLAMNEDYKKVRNLIVTLTRHAKRDYKNILKPAVEVEIKQYLKEMIVKPIGDQILRNNWRPNTISRSSSKNSSMHGSRNSLGGADTDDYDQNNFYRKPVGPNTGKYKPFFRTNAMRPATAENWRGKDGMVTLQLGRR